MRKVAKEAGLSPMAIYRHFASKEDLLEQLLIQGFRTFGPYLERGLAGQTAMERLWLTAEGYLDFACECSKDYELLFLAIDPSNHLKIQQAIRAEARATFNVLIDRVRDCIDAGVFVPGPERKIALSLLAQVNGLVALYLSGNFGWSRKQFAGVYRDSIERIFQGFLA